MTAESRAASLICWTEKVAVEPLSGGLTNRNFLVHHKGERYVVRIGDDNPVHLILRWHELAAAEAAYRSGIAPEIIHAEPGALVMRHIDGQTLTPIEVAEPGRLAGLVEVVRHCHVKVPDYFRGPALAFWPFHVARHYGRLIAEGGGDWVEKVPELLGLTARLEKGLGPVELVFGHNDLLAANFIDDGKRLWLIDYDYAGLNSPLFDLANLASNNGFSEEAEREMLGLYYGREADRRMLKSYAAMKAASLLRETMWSMVSETHSTIDFDYRGYTLDYRGRLDAAVAAFENIAH